jgi:hypothetical protein
MPELPQTVNGSTTDMGTWLRPSVLALIAANAVPLLGVLWFGWEVFPLLLLFWLENLIIGGFNVLKMVAASPGVGRSWLEKLFLVPFFAFHYGMFTMVHGVFVIGIFGGRFKAGAAFPDVETVLDMIREQHIAWGVLALALSHGISFAMNYIGGGEYRRASIPMLMSQPYGRIVVLHLAILGGGFLTMSLGSPTLGLALLVLLKIALDVSAHLKERRRFASGKQPELVEADID